MCMQANIDKYNLLQLQIKKNYMIWIQNALAFHSNLWTTTKNLYQPAKLRIDIVVPMSMQANINKYNLLQCK